MKTKQKPKILYTRLIYRVTFINIQRYAVKLGSPQIASSVVRVVALLLFKPLELKANTIASFLSFLVFHAVMYV